MQTENQKIGERGESLACRFLERKGYAILARNFRTRFGEIDIVVKKGADLIFVEVKTRKFHPFLFGHSALGSKKRSRMFRSALSYVQSIPYAISWRMDAVIITYHEKISPIIEHIESVEPPLP